MAYYVVPYFLFWLSVVGSILCTRNGNLTPCLLSALAGFVISKCIYSRYWWAKWALLGTVGLLLGSIFGATSMGSVLPIGVRCSGHVVKIFDKGVSVVVDRCTESDLNSGYLYVSCFGNSCPKVYASVLVEVTGNKKFGKFLARGKILERSYAERRWIAGIYYGLLGNGDLFRNGYLAWLRGTLPAEQSGFLTSMLFGETGLSIEFKSMMKDLGIVHIIAISGINIRYLQALVEWGVKFLRRKYRNIASLIPLIGLFIIVGPAISLVRAVGMVVLGIVMKNGGVIGNRHSFWAILALLLLLDPWNIYDAGYWLVTAACAGVYGGTFTLRRVRVSNAIRVLLESVVIWCCVAPVQWLIFRSMTPLGLVIGVILGPLVEVATILGYMGILARYVPILSDFFAFILGIIVSIMLFVTNLFHA